jgi:hypothetical protein
MLLSQAYEVCLTATNLSIPTTLITSEVFPAITIPSLQAIVVSHFEDCGGPWEDSQNDDESHSKHKLIELHC